MMRIHMRPSPFVEKIKVHFAFRRFARYMAGPRFLSQAEE